MTVLGGTIGISTPAADSGNPQPRYRTPWLLGWLCVVPPPQPPPTTQAPQYDSGEPYDSGLKYG